MLYFIDTVDQMYAVGDWSALVGPVRAEDQLDADRYCCLLVEGLAGIGRDMYEYVYKMYNVHCTVQILISDQFYSVRSQNITV